VALKDTPSIQFFINPHSLVDHVSVHQSVSELFNSEDFQTEFLHHIKTKPLVYTLNKGCHTLLSMNAGIVGKMPFI